MTKAVLAWASLYYGKGVGCKFEPINGKESIYEDAYNNYFLKPLKTMLGEDLDASMINMAVTHMNNRATNVWPYILNEIADYFYLSSGNFQKDFDSALQILKSEYTKHIATAFPTRGTDIEIFIDKHNTIVGQYPYKLFVYPADCAAHVNGRYVADLLEKNLLLIPDADKQLLTDMFEEGLLTNDNIRVQCTIPVANGGFQDVNTTIDDPRIPPTAVLQLINNLPSSLIAEHGNDSYAALRYYASTVEVSELVTWYLNVIADHFGDSLSITEDIENPGISTFEELSNNPEYISGTLDELIENYCKDNSIDKNCTIQQLIDHIDHLPTIEPESLVSRVAADKADRKLSGDTTLDEYISGTPHKHVDDVDVALSCVEGNPCFPPEVQKAIKDCILSDEPYKVPAPVVNYLEVLSSAGVEGEMASNIASAIASGTKVDMGKFDTQLLAQQLKNNPVLDDEMLGLILEAQRNKSVVSVKDVFLHHLPTLGLDSDTLSRMTIAVRTGSDYVPPAPTVIEQPLKRTIYDELGYNAGEVLLRATR